MIMTGWDLLVIVSLGDAMQLTRQSVERMDGVCHGDAAIEQDEQQSEEDEWADDVVQTVIAL